MFCKLRKGRGPKKTGLFGKTFPVAPKNDFGIPKIAWYIEKSFRSWMTPHPHPLNSKIPKNLGFLDLVPYALWVWSSHGPQLSISRLFFVLKSYMSWVVQLNKIPLYCKGCRYRFYELNYIKRYIEVGQRADCWAWFISIELDFSR